MGLMTREKSDDLFNRVTDIDEEQYRHMMAIRDAAKHFFDVACDHAPHCADTSSGLRKIREAVYDFNAAISLRGLI